MVRRGQHSSEIARVQDLPLAAASRDRRAPRKGSQLQTGDKERAARKRDRFSHDKGILQQPGTGYVQGPATGATLLPTGTSGSPWLRSLVATEQKQGKIDFETGLKSATTFGGNRTVGRGQTGQTGQTV